MLTVFKGDDTAFMGGNRLRVTLETGVDLSECCAEFELCGVVKRVRDVSSGSFRVNFTADETARMPVGVHAATIRVYDGEGRRRTIANDVRVNVTERVEAAYGGADCAEEVAMAVPLSGERMPAVPTQKETADAVKKIFIALGGVVNE